MPRFYRVKPIHENTRNLLELLQPTGKTHATAIQKLVRKYLDRYPRLTENTADSLKARF